MQLASKTVPGTWVFVGLFALIFCGIGILVGYSGVQAEDMTPAQENLIAIADWMVKGALGAVMGFAWGSRIVPIGGPTS